MRLLQRAIRLPLRLVPQLTPLRILCGPLAGKHWLSTSGTHGCWLGTYERDLQKEIMRSLRAGDIFYDIGANVGFFSLLASTVAARVVAFEPLPRNLELLRANLHLNDVTNVDIVEAAVADKTGTESFQEAGPSQGSLGQGRLEVKTVALDEMQLPPPTHLKIDVEGAESRVLEGAKALLDRARPVIFLSTHGWQQHELCWNFLKASGYRMRLRRDGSRDGQYESVATP